MGKKRKVVAKSSQPQEPPLKQQQTQPEPEPEPYIPTEQYQEVEEDEEEVEYEEVEVEEEEDEEEEQSQEEEYQEEEEDDEPIHKLIEPFTKEQIVSILFEAASKHRDVAQKIRNIADADATHRKIFVHGLGWDSTTETLIKAFSQYGEIEDCKAVADKVTGKSKGYGFILFKKRSGARNALKEPQKMIGNRMTACQLASIGPVQQTPQQIVQPAPQLMPQGSEYTQRKIFISNVGADLEPQKLLAYFSRFGEIEEGPLGLDKATGKPKGFCLFVYKSAESARRALEEPHKDFEGHILHCQRAIDGPKPANTQLQPKQLQQQQRHVATVNQLNQLNPYTPRTQFQRNDNVGFVGGSSVAVTQPGHLMAPAGPAVGYNQEVASAMQGLNPALGQALTALLASQGATLGLNNLLGSIGTSSAVNPGVPAVGHGVQSGYSVQPSITPSVMGAYGNTVPQVGLQVQYPNQHIGQGGSGRGQYGGGAPYTRH